MQMMRITITGRPKDKAEAQAAADVISDALPEGFRLDSAPWTKDCRSGEVKSYQCTVIGSRLDEAGADAAYATIEAALPDGFSITNAQYVEDLSAKRKAEHAASLAAFAAAKAEADRTAVEKIIIALEADKVLAKESKNKVKALITASTGIDLTE